MKVIELSLPPLAETGFLSHLWPALLNLSDRVRGVYIVEYPAEVSPTLEWFMKANLVRELTRGVCETGALAEMSNEAKDALKYGSYYNGHLSVLFGLDCPATELNTWSAFYPERAECSFSEFGGLTEAKKNFLKTSVFPRTRGKWLWGFAHDGDPLCCFERQ